MNSRDKLGEIQRVQRHLSTTRKTAKRKLVQVDGKIYVKQPELSSKIALRHERRKSSLIGSQIQTAVEKTLKDPLKPIEGLFVGSISDVPSLENQEKSVRESFIQQSKELEINSTQSTQKKQVIVEEIQRYKPPKKKNICVRLFRVLQFMQYQTGF